MNIAATGTMGRFGRLIVDRLKARAPANSLFRFELHKMTAGGPISKTFARNELIDSYRQPFGEG